MTNDRGKAIFGRRVAQSILDRLAGLESLGDTLRDKTEVAEDNCDDMVVSPRDVLKILSAGEDINRLCLTWIEFISDKDEREDD